VWIPAGDVPNGLRARRRTLRGGTKGRDIRWRSPRDSGWGLNEVAGGQLPVLRSILKKKTGVKMPKPVATESRWLGENIRITQSRWYPGRRRTPSVTGAGGRLPTEAEWEYAGARGDRGTRSITGGERAKPRQSQLLSKRGRQRYLGLHGGPARKFDPNPWKLFDMSGNVWEWCSDWYESALLRGNRLMPIPPERKSGTEHVKRGGSHQSKENELRLSKRGHFKGS